MSVAAKTSKCYSGSADVYRELVEDSQESWLLGLVAFAIVEEQRIEWMRHHEERTGSAPTAEQVQSWYEQQPPGALLRAKGEAENALEAFSADVSASMDEEYRRKIEESVIVSHIKSLGRFWPNFGVNLAGGIASSLLFGALLVAVWFLVVNDTSPVAIAKELNTPAEANSNGH